jgi:hypothetical protein
MAPVPEHFRAYSDNPFEKGGEIPFGRIAHLFGDHPDGQVGIGQVIL